jgi:hypothetical protein
VHREERGLKHESELPTAIAWRVWRAAPGDLYAAFAAVVAQNCTMDGT